MTQNNLTAWWSGKNKTPYGKSSRPEIIAVVTSVNIAYRNLLCNAHIGHFFEKMLHEQQSMSKMKRYGVLLPVLFILSGCLAAPIKPSVNKMAEIHTILVVPVESPPLEVIPDMIETRFPVYRQYQNQAMPHNLFLEEKIYRNPGGVLIAGLVSQDDSVSVADPHETLASMEKFASLEPTASIPENWTPTFILAQEAVSQLNGGGVNAMLSKHYYRLPIAGGNRNANLGNWHDAIRQWYNQSMSPVDYRQLGQEHVDAVLEVGIESYRIFDAQTSLQVLVKLVNPGTRQVIGRISVKDFSVEDMSQPLLSHEADMFKRLVTEMGKKLVARGFSGLGLAQNTVDQQIRSAQ